MLIIEQGWNRMYEGAAVEDERLYVLRKVFAPYTCFFLTRVSLESRARCLRRETRKRGRIQSQDRKDEGSK